MPETAKPHAATAGYAYLLPVWATALAYHTAFIWKTSFVIGATRYFSLFDDAMVSMQYARNLARGHGLTWNAGEPPIEGFSNPLWTLIMAAVHGLGLPPHRIAIAVQVLGALLLLALLAVTARLVEQITAGTEPPGRNDTRRAGASATAPQRRELTLAATVLVAFCYPLVYWTLMGMEVGLLALIATAAAVLMLGRRTIAGYVLLAIGTSVRMDFAVILLAFAVGGAALDQAGRSRHLRLGLGAAIAALGLQTLARAAYFHDPLPNTYYLKLAGFPIGLRLSRGAWVLLETVWNSRLLLVLLPLAGLALARGASRRRLGALLSPMLGVGLYSIWVGGDAWEGAVPINRYLTAALPLALVAAAWPLATLASRLGGRGPAAAALSIAFAIGTTLAISPHRLVRLADPPPYVRENAEIVSRGLAVRELTSAKASVAAAAVGGVAYFSERRIVDLLGKNDRVIARLPMRTPRASSQLTAFVPGHLKWDYGYSIGTLRPDVVAQMWWNPREADRYLARDYEMVDAVIGSRRLRFAVRRDSRLVRRPP